MKKLKQTDVKGECAEKRLINIARSLKKADHSFVRSVRKASPRLDKYGVDIIIFLHSLCGKNDIKVPVQVKSSYLGVVDYCKKHPFCVTEGVITIVVNDRFSDDDIRTVLERELKKVQSSGKDFTRLFEVFKMERHARVSFERGVPLKRVMKMRYIQNAVFPRISHSHMEI